MNQMKNRMQSLGLLDRSIKAATDEEIESTIASLDDDHREGLESFIDGELNATSLRVGAKAGRIDGGMEAIAAILTDDCLAECIEKLGDNADNPSTEQLQEVLPAVIESHGLASTRIMLAATVAGEAPASAIIRDLLKNDDVLALPKAEVSPMAPVLETSKRSAEEQAALRDKRAAARAAKKEAERARKAQAAAARRK